MKKFKYSPLLTSLLIAAVLVFTLVTTERQVIAQGAGYPTPEEALGSALEDYLAEIGHPETWVLGEVLTSGDYGYSIAATSNSANDIEDFVLLLAQQGEGGLWFYAAPEIVPDSEYNRWLAETPDTLIDPFGKSFYYLSSPNDLEAFNFLRSITLHKLPWPIREDAILTQKHGSYHTNQLDFVVRNTDDIYATEPGLVVFVKESSNLGGCDINLWPWANMVVVMHNLNEYTWYVHLKQNSVPVEVGDLVGYGTKIGEQGNTGFACGSSGIHLHFMVSNDVPTSWPDPTVPNYAPWPPGGSIVPIDFMEVSFAALVEGLDYESTNAPPPGICSVIGSAVNVYDNTYCNSKLLTVSTSGLVDLSGLEYGERIESLEVPPGWSLALYREENELGAKACLGQSDPMLWDNLFDNGEVIANRTVWMRIYQSTGCPYPQEQGIAFYPGANFLGTPTFGMVGARQSDGPDSIVGSVYLPGGYSVRLFDQDGGTGNTICLSSSVLDMSTLGVWATIEIESVEFAQGNICDPQTEPVPQPILTRPADNGTAYTEFTELCWDAEEYPQELSFNVVLNKSDGTFSDTSGWINDTCWSPISIVGQTGEYTWQVQAKNPEGDLGDWSVGFSFTLVEDEVAPLAAFRYLEDGSQVAWPRSNIFVNAADGETRVAKVHFFAWYDDGSGAGYDWHYVGVDEDGSDDWNILWSVVDVVSEDVALWIYAEDMGGNFASDFISGLYISEVQTGDGLIEGRDSENPRGDNGNGTQPPSSGEENEQNTGASSSTSVAGSGTEDQEDKPAVTTPDRTAPSAPLLSSPETDFTFYRADQINLCWQESSSGENVRYRVEITGDADQTSPWIKAACWKPTELLGMNGTFNWRVQARNSDGIKGNWSEASSFELRNDQTAPTVDLGKLQMAPMSDGVVEISISSTDGESGLYKLYLMAWYDAGDGYQWHELEALDGSSTSDYLFSWDVSSTLGQRVMVWVYAVDRSGNVSEDNSEVVFLQLTDTQRIGIHKKGLPDVLGRSSID